VEIQTGQYRAKPLPNLEVEGVTTISPESRAKQPEAPGSLFRDDDIVSSAWEHAAARSSDREVANLGEDKDYYNPFTHEAGYKLPIKIHPDLPPGTILMWCERLPPWYQSNEVPNVAEMKIRRDYYRVDWPLRTREREYGVYAEEVLAVYAPFAMAIMSNIPNA
jgi:hypothetical protein